ncbi:unnamed protein product [Brassica napus]|uniref:(rape) hypothetical protein n=1 Tax=Brassica napus TaxID=3708 RepID=A0A816YV10_BRANA|nr:unnamed protein product [Brassica napus]
MAMKRNGKSPVSSDTDEKFMFFKDVSLGPHENQLRFRLIHFWEARNPVKKKLIGLEMLLIDEQGTVIQGFISPGRIKKYLPDLKQGSVYTLKNFYGSRNKTMYRVADHIATVSFTWNSELSVLYEIPTSFDEDRFRFHSYEDFEANCDLKGDLYDVVGHMKLVNGQTLIERPTLDEVKIDTTRHIMVHVQSHDGPVMKLYLWDQAAADFCKKFNSYDNTPTVLLVTAVNTKRLGGTLALTSMSPTRVFMDYDVQPTIDYFNWLGSNPEIAMQVSADVVTKRETLTIADIFSYMKQESAKLGTILHAVDAMLRLPKANESEGDDHEVPVPEALISTIGQTHKFCVKVTEHNFSGSTRAITVTRILSLDKPPPTEASVGSKIAATSGETVQTGNEVCEPSKTPGDSADEESKRTFDYNADPEKAKRQRRDD